MVAWATNEGGSDDVVVFGGRGDWNETSLVL